MSTMFDPCAGRSLLLALLASLSVISPSAVLAQDDAAPAAAPNVEWPRQLDADGGTVVIYQPQLESFEGNRLQARAAISVTATGKTEPTFGAVWFDTRVSTDTDARLVTLEDVTVTTAKLPAIKDAAKLEQLKQFLETEIPKWNLVMSLDKLLASLELVEGEKSQAQNLKNQPPEIIYRTTPTVLIVIDGDPILEDFEGADLKYVVNTPFMILQEPGKGTFYLKGGESWYVAQKMDDAWAVTTDLPASVAEVARKVAEEEKKLAEANEAPPAAAESTSSEETIVPAVVLRTSPAELIQVNGEPNFASVEGTSLLYLANTESDILMDIQSQLHYVLLSGRWYASKSLAEGEWSFVAHDALPAEFKQIPADSDLGAVLPSVAGTQESQEAVLEASIPQTAAVDRKDASVEVTYDGDPKFEKCGDAEVYYAKNTDKAVFLIDKTYYCCDEAIWFVSLKPAGPWNVATQVPEEIQELPPDCPHYNVKYVYIYDSTPDVVYVGYTPGYTGAYVYGGCVVYGTGYSYTPWYGHHYYPYHATWGYGVHYNPYTGWGYSVGVTHGWVHIGITWGSPYHYGGWWGPSGYTHGYRHGYAHGHHHGYHNGFKHGYQTGRRAGAKAGYRAGQRAGHNNMYRNRPDGIRKTGGQRPGTRTPGIGAGQATGRRPGATPARKTPAVSKRQNNVVADRNGNVYRKQGDSWQKRDKGKWDSSGRSSASGSQKRKNLDREYKARQRGGQRTERNRASRSTSSRSRGGSRGGGKRR